MASETAGLIQKGRIMFFSLANIFLIGLTLSLLMLLALIPAGMAENRGRSFLRWYIYSLVLFPFAMFHAILVYEKPYSEINQLKAAIIEYLNCSPRYDELFGRRNYWDEVLVRTEGEINSNCPVDALSMTIRFSLESNGYAARLDFLNLSEQTIIGIKGQLLFRYLSPFGMPADSNEATSFLIQNRPAISGEIYSSGFSLPLNNIQLNQKTEAQLLIENILFADESVWTNHNNRGLFCFYFNTGRSREIQDIRLIAGADAVGYASTQEDHWMCVCGTINRDKQGLCKHCLRSETATVSSFDCRERVLERTRVYAHFSNKLENLAIPRLVDKVAEADSRSHLFRSKDMVAVIIMLVLTGDMLIGIQASSSVSLAIYMSAGINQAFEAIVNLL